VVKFPLSTGVALWGRGALWGLSPNYFQQMGGIKSVEAKEIEKRETYTQMYFMRRYSLLCFRY